MSDKGVGSTGLRASRSVDDLPGGFWTWLIGKDDGELEGSEDRGWTQVRSCRCSVRTRCRRRTARASPPPARRFMSTSGRMCSSGGMSSRVGVSSSRGDSCAGGVRRSEGRAGQADEGSGARERPASSGVCPVSGRAGSGERRLGRPVAADRDRRAAGGIREGTVSSNVTRPDPRSAARDARIGSLVRDTWDTRIWHREKLRLPSQYRPLSRRRLTDSSGKRPRMRYRNPILASAL